MRCNFTEPTSCVSSQIDDQAIRRPRCAPLQRSDSPPPYRSCPEQRNLQVTDTAFKLPCLNESWFEDVQLLSFRLSYLDHHGLSFAIVCNDLELRPVSHGKDRVFRWVDLFPLTGSRMGHGVVRISVPWLDIPHAPYRSISASSASFRVGGKKLASTELAASSRM